MKASVESSRLMKCRGSPVVGSGVLLELLSADAVSIGRTAGFALIRSSREPVCDVSVTNFPTIFRLQRSRKNARFSGGATLGRAQGREFAAGPIPWRFLNVEIAF